MTSSLDRKDRMSVGQVPKFEVPVDDERIKEYLNNIPWEMKFYKSVEKGLLNKAWEVKLLRKVLYRKQMHNPHYKKIIEVSLRRVLSDLSSILHEIFDKKL